MNARLALLGLVLLAACSEGAAQEPAPAPVEPLDRPTIAATGIGRASGPPDTLAVSLTVHTDAPSAAETLDTTSLRTQQLLDTARGQGVAEEDLRTTNVYVYPRYNDTGTRIVGYSADNSFTIRYRDLEAAGGLLDALVGVGGDFVRVDGVDLELDDPTALQDDARDDAVDRAMAQAAQLADAAGVELGDVRRVLEVPVGTTIEDLQALGAVGGAASFQRDAAVAVPIAEGGREVTVQVVVLYDIAG
jgi:uncharacterized protein YggE